MGNLWSEDLVEVILPGSDEVRYLFACEFVVHGERVAWCYLPSRFRSGILERFTMTHMTSDKRLDLAKEQLTRTLSFFPRLDSKMSVVLAIDTSMLAFLATRAPALTGMNWCSGAAAVIAILLLATSLWYLYRGGAPDLKGGHRSLIYFREIAVRTESHYIDDFLQIDDLTYMKDLLGQTWRNSEILATKFNHLEIALRLLAAAIVPWLLALMLFARQASSIMK
jgi:hypothetical protein